jgi:GrpB-like predicted nucleotidyltransferase (UPF0157 family)
MKIEIFPYDPRWVEDFKQLARPLREALDDVALRIDHIGPTSIPGAAAKPTIDIQISVASFDPFDPIRLPLETLGYVWKADNPERSKRYFRESPGARRIHIHVRRSGSWSEQFALLFRDYMRQHPADVAQYVDLKYKLAAQYGEDRQGYTDAKNPFIWQVMMKADAWCQSIGWLPGASDM